MVWSSLSYSLRFVLLHLLELNAFILGLSDTHHLGSRRQKKSVVVRFCRFSERLISDVWRQSCIAQIFIEWVPTKVPDTAGCFETTDESDVAPCLHMKECSDKERRHDRAIAIFNTKKQGVKWSGKLLQQNSQEIIFFWQEELRENSEVDIKFYYKRFRCVEVGKWK